MAFRTFDIPQDLLDELAACARNQEVDPDQVVQRALDLYLRTPVPAPNDMGYASSGNPAGLTATGEYTPARVVDLPPFKERPTMLDISTPPGAVSVRVTINALSAATIHFIDKDGATVDVYTPSIGGDIKTFRVTPPRSAT